MKTLTHLHGHFDEMCGPLPDICIVISEPYLGFFLSMGGQTSHTFTGVSRIQTGFLVGRFVFIHTQKVAFKTFKEINDTGAFCFNFS